MKLSVIILNYNVRYFLEQCVASVQKALIGIDGEIIVVDNNSHDDSCEMIKRLFPNVGLIANRENTGFPKGNNIGVAAASGEYLCILNPDTVVAEDTFNKVLAFAESQQNLGIVGVKLIDGTGNFLPESKRGTPTPTVALTKIVGLYKIFPKLFGQYYAAHVSPSQTGKVDILVGAFMILKRELYLEVGGFDEDCFMYSDDIDLSYSILKRGKDNFYFHDTEVIHYKGESTIKDERYMNRFREAMGYFYKKHFQSSPVFDVFMVAGAYFFALAKRTKKPQKINPLGYTLISSNEMLAEQIATKTGLECKMISSLDDLVVKPGTQIIFDSDFIDYKGIIDSMQTLSSQKATFKIYNNQSSFLIGSNSSDDRGEVIVLDR